MRYLALSIALLLQLGLPRHAAADEPVLRVAVLPFLTDDGLAIYGMPAAEAVAKQLSASGLAVAPLSLSGPVPSGVGLVVDGRISRTGKRVTLEARVRDPRRGRLVIDTLVTDAAPLSKIDELARSLASQLGSKLRGALEEQTRLAAAEARAHKRNEVIRLPTTVVRAPAVGDGAARPRMLVFRAGGDDAAIVTPFGYWLAERLGYEPVGSSHDGVPPGQTIAAELQRTGAELALMIDVKKVDLDYDGVLSARGRVRVLLADASRRVLFDRTARTGTLVGSRGDGPDALVHYISEQTIEIVMPHLKRRLEGRRE